MTALGPYLPRGTLSSRVQPTLDADGLVLRPWRDDDAAVVAKAYGEPDISHFNRRTMATEAEALEWIRRWSTRWQEESGANWAVCSSGRNVVGRVALSRVNLYEGDAELGYWVLPGDRGNAVASRAVDALARWAFGGRPHAPPAFPLGAQPGFLRRRPEDRFRVGRNQAQCPQACGRLARHASACCRPPSTFEFYLSVKARRSSQP